MLCVTPFKQTTYGEARGVAVGTAGTRRLGLRSTRAPRHLGFFGTAVLPSALLPAVTAVGDVCTGIATRMCGGSWVFPWGVCYVAQKSSRRASRGEYERPPTRVAKKNRPQRGPAAISGCPIVGGERRACGTRCVHAVSADPTTADVRVTSMECSAIVRAELALLLTRWLHPDDSGDRRIANSIRLKTALCRRGAFKIVRRRRVGSFRELPGALHAGSQS